MAVFSTLISTSFMPGVGSGHPLHPDALLGLAFHQGAHVIHDFDSIHRRPVVVFSCGKIKLMSLA